VFSPLLLVSAYLQREHANSWRKCFLLSPRGAALHIVSSFFLVFTTIFVVRFLLPTTTELGDRDPAQHRGQLNERLRWACKISVVMDVGGKFFTYVVLSVFDKSDEEHMPNPVMLLEYFTTIVEASVKWQHASHARAREFGDDLAGSYKLLAVA